MSTIDFVEKDSIVRRIWGNTDCILFIFAGAAAEFSLNKQVDWLYFTGKLPGDPLGRLFSTVSYAQKIVFASTENANTAIDQINMIHRHVENARGAKIPDWAYRDVLFMLINYSISAFEVLQRKLSIKEKEEIFSTFQKVGQRMEIGGLPSTFVEWQFMHQAQLEKNLLYSKFTEDLFRQYRKHLGAGRYYLLKKVQAILAPQKVKELLGFGSAKMIEVLLKFYKVAKILKLGKLLRNLILPRAYKAQILDLDKLSIKKCPFTGMQKVQKSNNEKVQTSIILSTS
jgi:uncharacterized protein (DUF2236 family)